MSFCICICIRGCCVLNVGAAIRGPFLLFYNPLGYGIYRLQERLCIRHETRTIYCVSVGGFDVINQSWTMLAGRGAGQSYMYLHQGSDLG
jgi:hypothetical protein